MNLAPDFRMRFIRRTMVGVATLGVLTSLAVAPAFAETEVVSFSITPGTLGLETKTATSFDAVDFQLSGTPATTDSDYVYTVADLTGNLTKGWTVTVAGTDLINGTYSIPVSNIELSVEGAVLTAGADAAEDLTETSRAALSGTGATILEATGGQGDGQYDHTVNLEVTVPNGTAAGAYSGTLTFTVTAETP